MEMLIAKFLLKKLNYKVILNAYGHVEVYKGRTLIRCFYDKKQFILWAKLLRKLELV